MSGLRALGALLLIGCGGCAGSAWQARLKARTDALRQTVRLLRRVRQEVAYRRTDFARLAQTLCREGILPPGAVLQGLAPPPALRREEAACFAECFGGLGRSGAEQECARLDYYIGRFEEFTGEAQRAAAAQAGLACRLGLAAGAVLALLFL